jgi:hypothetical protein
MVGKPWFDPVPIRGSRRKGGKRDAHVKPTDVVLLFEHDLAEKRYPLALEPIAFRWNRDVL